MQVKGLNWGMMTFAVGLKHAEMVYDWTGAITKAISRCGLDGQYWISTKDCGTTIVIHCEDHFYEGDCEKVAAEASRLTMAVEFEGLLELSGLLERGEYPWVLNTKEVGQDDTGD